MGGKMSGQFCNVKEHKQLEQRVESIERYYKPKIKQLEQALGEMGFDDYNCHDCEKNADIAKRFVDYDTKQAREK
jgi:hypothetical protein